jgi:hypothetical protein
MEALIFMFDVACMTYLCWRVFKSDASASGKVDFGFFRYRVHGEDPEPQAAPRKGSGERPRA